MLSYCTLNLWYDFTNVPCKLQASIYHCSSSTFRYQSYNYHVPIADLVRCVIGSRDSALHDVVSVFNSVDIIFGHGCTAITYILTCNRIAGFADFIMSEPLSSFERFLQQYPNANFNSVVKLKKLTRAEIVKYTGKKQKKQRRYKPAKKFRKDKNITVQKEVTSVHPNVVIPSVITTEQTVEKKGMESIETVQKEVTSVHPNVVIPSEITTEQTVENKEMESKETVQKEEKTSVQPYVLIPTRLIKQEIENDSYMDNETQSMNNMSNLPNDFFPNVVIKQEAEDDGYENNYNVEQDNDNMFDPSNVFIPNIFDPEMQNDNMENYMPITAQENMFGLSNNFTPNFIYEQELTGIHMGNFIPQGNLFDPSNNIIPNMINGQAYQNSDNVGINIPQTNQNMSSRPDGFRPLIIKEENRNYDFVDEYVAQDDMYDPSNNLIPKTIDGQGIKNNNFVDEYIAQDNMYDSSNNLIPKTISRQGIQNNDNVGINIPKKNENTPSSSNGNVPKITIKQEILDDGNIEINTDVLKPSADQEYEDETPW
ncbi:hypothetical protein AGLY_009001 [Aphis glycines]|uniref:Uncharacterized protein n=1 Tax=Aphis glycines TaxID=307491 RepID=A0A6G0TLJ8_APHGL|nr:hypothetical protein AGLY_009001 [Aphis glycines]